ncbi:hypothetical protein Ptr902_11128 [Pyrenophora tritici-repentis]|uniref:Uncharacterized protein n=1 Tax=Pyrenophora tritici-repentis TaxID=45151 RepID=A0A834RLT1_9PLEO|nr:hypothetical protein PtrM4_052760 [Pyrenophora tritici-repentis]KAI0574766.1 hypothetical protein Alg215_08401 [Pyrenophora tritici-repentis]KAI0575522.1 hypothetical protein Alg130_09234 [Pyrenophora tritici-repentis]KAI2477503.1 hypothetical protein Ptr902_11128 [Pyrenophora tritici-repentis]
MQPVFSASASYSQGSYDVTVEVFPDKLNDGFNSDNGKVKLNRFDWWRVVTQYTTMYKLRLDCERRS